MIRILIFMAVGAISLGLLNACGPSEEEIAQQEQARQDSLEQVRQQQLEQQRQDSLQQARQDSIKAAEEEEERNRIDFVDEGPYAVQVEAWRSRSKAENQVDKWIDRGYEGAYAIKTGNEDTGNIWYRVRLGYLETEGMADKLQDKLQREYKEESWVSIIQ